MSNLVRTARNLSWFHSLSSIKMVHRINKNNLSFNYSQIVLKFLPSTCYCFILKQEFISNWVGVSKQLRHLIWCSIIRCNLPMHSIESSSLLERKQPDYLVILDPTIQWSLLFWTQSTCYINYCFQQLVCLKSYLTSVWFSHKVIQYYVFCQQLVLLSNIWRQCWFNHKVIQYYVTIRKRKFIQRE